MQVTMIVNILYMTLMWFVLTDNLGTTYISACIQNIMSSGWLLPNVPNKYTIQTMFHCGFNERSSILLLLIFFYKFDQSCPSL